MRLSTARDQFLTERRFGGPGRRALSERTLIRYKFALSGFIDWLIAEFKMPRRPADSVLMFNAERAREYIEHRQGLDLKPRTLSIDCAALRELAKWGVRKRYWTEDAVADMPAVIRPDSTPRALSDEERNAVMALPLYGDDLLLRALLYYSGAREDELLRLKLGHVQQPTGDHMGALRLWGKGSRERSVPITPDLWHVLGPYWNALKDKPRDWHVLMRGEGQPWTSFMIISRVKRWGKAAGVENLTPHVLRHTFATNVYELTNDIRVVQELLGHKNLNTTQIYTRVVSSRREAAVLKLPSFTPSVHRSGSVDPRAPERANDQTT